jgi:hypothetical protein
MDLECILFFCKHLKGVRKSLMQEVSNYEMKQLLWPEQNPCFPNARLRTEERSYVRGPLCESCQHLASTVLLIFTTLYGKCCCHHFQGRNEGPENWS